MMTKIKPDQTCQSILNHDGPLTFNCFYVEKHMNTSSINKNILDKHNESYTTVYYFDLKDFSIKKLELITS